MSPGTDRVPYTISWNLSFVNTLMSRYPWNMKQNNQNVENCIVRTMTIQFGRIK